MSENLTASRPMRSVIMVSVRDDSYLPLAYRWLYKHHVPESISQFSPYVTKYATYRALPLPPGAEDFGAYNWIMTEHYWLIDPFNNSGTCMPDGLSFAESFDAAYLEATRQPTGGPLRGHEWQGSREGYHPTVFAFLPVFWEEDYKGCGRTIEDGANFRWLLALKYPAGVSETEGEVWFREVFAPAVAACPEVTRFVSSRVLAAPKTGPFKRVAEIWFENSRGWEATARRLRESLLPGLEPYRDLVSVFLLDRPESDHLRQYCGYISTR